MHSGIIRDASPPTTRISSSLMAFVVGQPCDVGGCHWPLAIGKQPPFFGKRFSTTANETDNKLVHGRHLTTGVA